MGRGRRVAGLGAGEVEGEVGVDVDRAVTIGKALLEVQRQVLRKVRVTEMRTWPGRNVGGLQIPHKGLFGRCAGLAAGEVCSR